MANFYGMFRTNYFKVKDLEAFKARLEEIREEHPDIEVWEEKTRDGQTLVGFGGYCSFPDALYNEEDGEYVDLDLMGEIAEHLEDNWVAVMTHCGNEKLRYLSAGAEAINSKGEREYFDLFQFMEKAKELGENCTLPEY